MTTELHLRVDDIPPSTNGLYTVVHGRKILTKKGLAWKQRFIATRGGISAQELMQFRGDIEQEYDLDLWFYLSPERLYSAGYGTDKRVKYPFRNLDTSNLFKLMEDSIAELTGLQGDRANFDIHAHKRPTAGSEFAIAHLVPSSCEEDPRCDWRT